MTETKENLGRFIAKLQEEGVEKGHAEAEKIKAAATEAASQIIVAAKAEAEKILADASKKGEARLQQAQVELNLAARDTVLNLKQSIAKMVEAILRGSVENRLKDPAFVGDLIKNVVSQYVQADAQGKECVVTVQRDLLDTLKNSVMAELSAGTTFVGGLSEAGFEFTSLSGTVEITPDSIAEVLAKYVNVDLQEAIAAAVQE